MTHDNRSRITVDAAVNWRIYSNTLPAGAEALGSVTRGTGETGALIRYISTGQYAQLNAGALRTLDQRKVHAALEAASGPAR